LVKYVIKIELAKKSHSELKTFADNVVLEMTGNPDYATPNPTLIQLGTLITAFGDALTDWGTFPGNRGTTVESQAVVDTRNDLEVGLTSLANYCMTTTPYQKAAFLSAGWEVKKLKSPIGPLPAPANLRVATGDSTPNGGLKLRWERLNGAGTYNVLRSDDNGATFHVVANVTKASFIDTGLDSAKVYRYAVQAVGAAGVGVNSDICFAQPVINVIS